MRRWKCFSERRMSATARLKPNPVGRIEDLEDHLVGIARVPWDLLALPVPHGASVLAPAGMYIIGT
jgi:hypothetical protein